MKILMSDRFLITIHAMLEVTDVVLPNVAFRAVPPRAAEDKPVMTTGSQGPAHGLFVLQRV